MKLLSIILLVFCTSAFAQSNSTISTIAMVGDSVFLFSDYAGDDSYCGRARGSVRISDDVKNFSINIESWSSPFKANVYFVPKEAGHFLSHFSFDHVYEFYMKKGCSNFNSGGTYAVDCTSLPDTLSMFLPQSYGLYFQVNFPKRQYEADLSLTYRNNTPNKVIIKEIRYLGDTAKLTTVTYSDSTPLSSIRTIESFKRTEYLNLHFTSKEGPYLFYGTPSAGKIIISKEINGIASEDTLLLSIQYQEVSFVNEIQIDPPYGYSVNFDSKIGDTLFRTASISYSDIIENIHFYEEIPDSTGFKLSEVEHLQNKKILHFRFIPRIEGYQGYEYHFNYLVKLFNNTEVEFAYNTYIELGAFVQARAEVSNNLDSKFAVIPNPARDNITIRLSEAVSSSVQVSISDELGRNIFAKEAYPSSNQFILSLDRNLIRPGLYYLKILADRKSYVEKIIIADN